MRLHYQRVNPDVGGESILLRFEGLFPEQTVCVLVNSGRGVAVDTLLDEFQDEYLGGIIVNNAHPEYYCTLGENLYEETPVYASRDTAAILSEALSEPNARDIENSDAVLDQLVPIDDWTQVARGLQIHPVSSGHAPGTAGVLFEIQEQSDERTQGQRGQEQKRTQSECHTLFLADEFTVRRAAGYPGVGIDFPVAIDALVLSEATEAEFTPTLTETLSIICERARNDARVLVTADEPTGIHAAYLLGHLGKRLGSPFPITITGRIATLCEQLGYSIPNVTPLPEATPQKILTPGTVAIACPNSPVQGVSGQLFETLADDPTAAVIRLTRGVPTPMSAARCMVQSFPWHNRSDRETLDSVVTALAPIQVIFGDQTTIDETDRASRDYDSFVWTVDDDLVYTLYDGTRWVAPAETDPEVEQQIRNRVTDRHDEPVPSESERSLPLPQRQDGIDFTAEGLDINEIQDRLLPSGPSDSDADTDAKSWRRSAPEEDRPATSPNGDTATTSATDGGTTSIDASLAALREQIDDIESFIEKRTYQARIIDAGSDMCLFRVQDPPVSFEHGQDISVVLDVADDAAEQTASKRENGSETTTANETH